MTDSDRLARIEEKIDGLAVRFDDFRVEVAQRLTALEVKAAVWGALAGAVGAGIFKVVVR